MPYDLLMSARYSFQGASYLHTEYDSYSKANLSIGKAYLNVHPLIEGGMSARHLRLKLLALLVLYFGNSSILQPGNLSRYAEFRLWSIIAGDLESRPTE